MAEDQEEQADRDENLPAPWEADAHGEAEGGKRRRHDAFTDERRRIVLKTLSRTGCMADACRAAGVSRTTVYNLQQTDEQFARDCELALHMARTPVEIAAWERGVVGVEEEVIRGGQVVGTRLKRSDSILRLLLQGSNRNKYGPRPGFSRKRMLKHERKQIERELRAELEEKMRPRSLDEVRASILRKLGNIARHREPALLEAGWTRTRDGRMIPPGWVWSGDSGDGEHDAHGPAAEG